MLKEITKLRKAQEACYFKFRKEYEKAREKFSKKLLKLLPYEGNYIKVLDDFERTKYIKVRELFRHGDDIIIRGYGFYGEFTEWADACYASWDFMTSYEFKLDDVETKVKNITIISKEEFDKALKDIIKEMLEDHEKELK